MHNPLVRVACLLLLTLGLLTLGLLVAAVEPALAGGPGDLGDDPDPDGPPLPVPGWFHEVVLTFHLFFVL